MNYLKRFGSFLDKLSYFFPDVFLGFAVYSAVTEEWRDVVVFCIAYMATCYGEYMYSKVRISREIMLNKVVPTLNQLEKKVNDEEVVKLDGFLRVCESIDEDFLRLQKRVDEVDKNIEEHFERIDENLVRMDELSKQLEVALCEVDKKK